MPLERHEFEDEKAACEALALAASCQLIDALENWESVIFLVSGGRTPQRILPLIASAPLDFSRVIMLASDERIVPLEHSDSTEGMVKGIFRDQGVTANYVGLGGNVVGEQALRHWLGEMESLNLPIAAALLGVGEDGHFASLFPRRDEVRNLRETAMLVPQSPPHRHMRVTLGLKMILRSQLILIPVFGRGKRTVIDRALQKQDAKQLPVSSLLHQNLVRIETFEV